MGSLSAVDIILGLVFVYLLYANFTRFYNKRARPLPPGPKRRPLIGNLFDLPTGFEATHWEKHRKLYGMALALCRDSTTSKISIT